MEYNGKIDIYKVGIDRESELEKAFRIRTIPNLLLCTVEGKPTMKLGTLNKIQLKELIEKTFFLNLAGFMQCRPELSN